jgi:hypothetical protein
MIARVSLTCLSLFVSNGLCEWLIGDPVLRIAATTVTAGMAAVYLLLYGITQS